MSFGLSFMSFLTDKMLSVVIPCYNEESNIPELYQRLSKVLRESAPQYEIIFVDNVSRDRTRELLRDFAARDGHVKALFFARNYGNSQYGYSAGTEYARGDAIIWMEADLQDPPEVITEFIKKWQEGFKVVYGVRPRSTGSFFSRLFRRGFYRLFDKLSYLNIPADAGDFSLLDRQVADVFNKLPERSRFVRGIRAWLGFRHTGVVYNREDRKGGVTSNPGFAKNFWWAKKFIFSFSEAPFAFITRVAFWIAILFPFFAITFIILAFFGTLSWFAALVSIIVLFLLTFHSIALSFLGEAVSIMFEETKQRPKYIVEEALNVDLI